MKSMKQRISALILSTTLTVGAISVPNQKAEAGVIVAAASSLYVTIPALAIAGMLGGFGTAVGSIYYAIDHRDQAWWAYAFFMLDAELQSGNLQQNIEQRYPGIDSTVAAEIARIVTEKAKETAFDDKGLKEIILSESELTPVTDLLAETDPALGQKLKNELTLATLVK
jgi:hypothetical protein